MSVRAELLRLALRATFKQRGDVAPNIAHIRARLEKFKYLAPPPPKGTQATRLAMGGVPAIRVTTRRSRPDRHVLYLHGGAYVYGRPGHYRDFIWRIADAAAATIHVLDYRLGPEHPFPAAVDDSVKAYRSLLAAGADPRHLAIMGDSAGGGLSFATLLRLRDERGPLPAAAVAMSPWTDLTLTSESCARFAASDPMLSVGPAKVFARWYLADVDPKHPYASPLYGDPTGLPPSLIQVGGDEILRDDAVLWGERMRAGGVAAEVEVWPRMPHAWQLFARMLPEGQQAVDRIGAFLRSQFAGIEDDPSPARLRGPEKPKSHVLSSR
jgi:acetyl esterase/lipase